MMGKDTQKRSGKRPTRKKVVKPNEKGTARSSAFRDKKIVAGEYKIEEIETLRLQKLMHQVNSLGQQVNLLADQYKKKQGETVSAAEKYEAMLSKVKKVHGLKKYHDIKLDDEEGGLVVINAKTKAEAEAEAEAEAN